MEEDAIFFGWMRAEKHGCRATNKMLITITAQADGKWSGRMRMCRVSDSVGDTLEPAVLEMVELGR